MTDRGQGHWVDVALEMIDDCGHAPQLEVPDQFLTTVVPWLSNVLAAC